MLISHLFVENSRETNNMFLCWPHCWQAHFARPQNTGVVIPAIPRNIVGHQYSVPGMHGVLPPHFPSFGYQQYPRQNLFFGLVPNVMMPHNIPRPMHHGDRVGAWRGVGREIHQQQQQVFVWINGPLTCITSFNPEHTWCLIMDVSSSDFSTK
jgi:hypothetical protein